MIATIVLIVAGAYGVLVVGLYVFQRGIMYVPERARPDRADFGAAHMTEVTLVTEDGLELFAWHRPAPAERPTVVFFHGNAGHIGYRTGRAATLAEAGLGVLLVEYRGYGGNPGSPTEAGLYADGRAAMAFLEGEGVPPERTVLFGESLGSGVAVQIAVEQAEADRPVGAVVLEAPLSSAADIGARQYPIVPVRLLIKDRYDNTAKIAGIGAPLFLYHGDADLVIPQHLGRKLFEAAREPKDAWWIPGGGHSDLDEFGAAQRVIAFVERTLGAGD